MKQLSIYLIIYLIAELIVSNYTKSAQVSHKQADRQPHAAVTKRDTFTRQNKTLNYRSANYYTGGSPNSGLQQALKIK